jgi:DNA polymerase III sliding clamp (beta) subunit (PCNA family)
MDQVTVAADRLVAALRQVLPAASRNRKDRVLQSVLFQQCDGSLLHIVATDRHRLAVAEIPIHNGSGSGEFRALVAHSELEDFDPGASSTVTMRADGASLQIESAGATTTFDHVPGEFPDYQRFLAVDPDATALVVDRAALVDAIEELADDEPMRFVGSSGGLEVGDSPPIHLPAQHRGEQVTFLMNPDFAHDALVGAAGPQVVIEATGPRSPVMIRSEGGASYVAIVMPVVHREPKRKRRPASG